MRGLGTVLYSLAVPGVLALALPVALLLRDSETVVELGPWHLLGALPLAGGIALYAWAAAGFVRRGRGTPAPFAPPRALVTRGPYRWSRNPMYVATMACVGGFVVLLPTPVLLRYALGTAVTVALIVLAWEEPVLRRRYGAAYRDYCARVPRWFPLRPLRARGG